jgi:predicted dehydrogenase
MAEMLRVGILGAGWAAEGHAAAYSRLPDVEVTALWNRTRGRAEALAGKLRHPTLKVYDNWQELITESDCDVMSIATAPMLRSDPLLMALDHGCHVLVEKPMSIGVREAESMVEAARKAASVTACCFNWRYAPANQAAWRAIRAGEIGAIRDVRTEWYLRARSDFFRRHPWVRRMDTSNGSLGEGLSHDFDKARFLTGEEFREIASRITPVTIKQDDNFLVDGGRSMHFAELTSGVLAQFCLAPTAGEDMWRMTIVGDEGSLTIPDAGTTVVRQRHDEQEPGTLTIAAADQAPSAGQLIQHTWNRLIEDFIGAVRDGDLEHRDHTHLPTLTDGLRTEEVIAAARQSSSERRWVTVGSQAPSFAHLSKAH